VATSVSRASFPYVPGFLTFREGPVLLEAFSKLERLPDAVIFDGQGIAHPRGFGIAAHIGVILDVPSVGCAKTRLVGSHGDPANERGSSSPLLDKSGEQIGSVVRTRANVKPVYVSIGNKVDLGSAIRLVLACAPKYRLPEQTRLAHKLSNELRTEAAEDIS